MTIALILATLLLAGVNGLRQQRRIKELEHAVSVLGTTTSTLQGNVATLTTKTTKGN
jgi:hypothetical protein